MDKANNSVQCASIYQKMCWDLSLLRRKTWLCLCEWTHFFVRLHFTRSYEIFASVSIMRIAYTLHQINAIAFFLIYFAIHLFKHPNTFSNIFIKCVCLFNAAAAVLRLFFQWFVFFFSKKSGREINKVEKEHYDSN